jgi:hypothetical protein
MSSLVADALKLWTDGQDILVRALKLAESGPMPPNEDFRRFDEKGKKLRHELRRIGGIVADDVFLWNAGAPVSSGYELEVICKATAEQDDPEKRAKVNWKAINAWAKDRREWFADLAKDSGVGVTIRDVALAIEDGDDMEAKRLVKRLSDSKKITAKPLGRCPNDRRARLYELTEILTDVQRILSLSRHEFRKYFRVLSDRTRKPET